jgi:hypothetical protein
VTATILDGPQRPEPSRLWLLIAAIIAAITLSGCAWFEAQRKRDEQCLPICATQLGVDQSQVLGTMGADGRCACALLNEPPPITPSCPQAPCPW